MVYTDVEEYTPAYDCRRLALFLMGGALLLLPLAVGGNRLFPLAVCQAAMAGAFLAMACIRGFNPPAWPRRLKVAAILFATALAWALLQAAPFTPQAWHHPLWREASEQLLLPYRGSISISPESTLHAINRLTTYGLMIVGVFCLARHDEYAASWLVRNFWRIGVGLCLYGVMAYITGFNPLLQEEKNPHLHDVTATFVNRNHFADYAGLTMMTGLGLAWNNFIHAKREAIAENQSFSVLSWLARTGWLYSLGIAIALAALVMSHSRAGMVASFLGVSVFIGAYLLYRRNYKMALNVPFVVILLAFCLIAVFFQYGRFSNLMQDGPARFGYYERALDMIKERPWSGYGLGSFEQSLMPHYDSSFHARVHRLHNDWLEMFFDLGLWAGCLLLVAIGLTISSCWHGIRTRRRCGLYPALGLGASALVLTHGLFDFSLQIPGIIAPWAILLGSGLAHSWSLHTHSHPGGTPPS